MMTCKEIAEKYGAKQCDISTAICNKHVLPKGYKDGGRRVVKTFDEKEVLSAIADMYDSRAENYKRRMLRWQNEAERMRAGL